MSPEQLRAYWCQLARGRRERRDLEANRTALTCRHRTGRGVCGGSLETVIRMGGATAIVCQRCERRKAGRCVDCGQQVDGALRLALRCAPCRKAACVASRRLYQVRYPERVRQSSREYQRRRRAV